MPRMNRFATPITFALFLSFLPAVSAQAAPMYYTFEGSVTSLYMASYGGHQTVVGKSGISVGDYVKYVFMVDLARNGTVGNIEIEDRISSGPIGTHHYDYFFDSLISSTDAVVVEQNTPAYVGGSVRQMNCGTNDIFNYNPPWNQTYSDTKTGSLVGGSNFDRMTIDSWTALVSEWSVGDTVRGLHQIADVIEEVQGISTTPQVVSSLTLTGISDTLPVPEPSTLLLLGSGLIGLGEAARRRKARGQP